MADQPAERSLPRGLLGRASLAGNEYAWRVEHIPEVIEAARQAGLVNLGGQLQFRLPGPVGGTCDCYWVEVNTYEEAPPSLPWAERVEKAADAAAAGFWCLRERFDFAAVGREWPVLAEFETKGGSLPDAARFVWYVLDENGASQTET